MKKGISQELVIFIVVTIAILYVVYFMILELNPYPKQDICTEAGHTWDYETDICITK